MLTALLRTQTLPGVLAVALALGLTGCGSQSAPGTPGTPVTKRATAAPRPVRPEDTISPNMVAAVAMTKGAAPAVQVKFELGAHPEVGQPLEIALVIIPTVGTLGQISGQVQGEDGLEVVNGAVIPPTEKPVLGTPIHHTLSVVPRRDGVFVLTATIASQAGDQTQSEAFSIPIIAGSPLSAAAGAAAPRPAAAPKPPPAATR